MPRMWDSIMHPHVALLQRHEDLVVCFFLSNSLERGGKLHAGDLEAFPPDSVIEVRRNQTD
ncbi:MAG: hypothetical protein KGY80_10615 [Candidatus Thorarchaeota archaeon]|nr:hypothetical protein [Candidatus Thorarchaeota archaeon]